MTVRFEPILDDTEALLGQILTHILKDDERAAFLVPAGQSFHVLARIRTMISRKRRKLLAAGKKPKRFRLNSTVHPETHDGKRLECIVLWRQVDDSHLMTEHLEDMLSNG